MNKLDKIDKINKIRQNGQIRKSTKLDNGQN